MNLHDLIKRGDRYVEVLSGTVLAGSCKLRGRTERSVSMSSGSSFMLRKANGIEALKNGIRKPDWCQIVAPEKGGSLRVSAVSGAGTQAVNVLSSHSGVASEEVPIAFSGAILESLEGDYDLHFEAVGGEVLVGVGPQYSPREAILRTLVGKGVELGPGLNPAVRPSSKIDVTYIEQTAPSDWAKLYNANGKDNDIPSELKSRYLIDSAVSPKHIAERSIDFAFSNHVCEHLPNFGQVLKNWSVVLKKGGKFCGVVPDCRYSFDYRQTPTPLSEILDWESSGGFEIPDRCYDLWCKFTEPNHTMAALKARGYSIHVNYFTPAVLASLFEYYCARGYFESFQIYCHRNGRDIGFSTVT